MMCVIARNYLIFIVFPILFIACSPLQSARIRQEVTIDTHFEGETNFSNRTKMMILTLAQKEKTLAKTTLTANEAAVDILSLEFLNRGFQVLDRAVINDYMSENQIELDSVNLEKIFRMGRTLQSDFLIITSLFENLQSSHKLDFLPWNVLTSFDTSANIGISSRMIDLTNGKVIWIGIATTQDQNFQIAIQRIATKLILSLEDQSRKQE
jgi:hypothetical protein